MMCASRKTFAIAAAAALVAIAEPVAAQTLSSPPHTASADCRTLAASYQNKQLADLRARGETLTAALVNPILTEARRIGRECGAKISMTGASVTELVDLSALDLFAG